MKKSKGFTLIELLVTLAIMGILAIAAVTSFSGTNLKKAVESEARTLNADILSVQAQAMDAGKYYDGARFPYRAVRIYHSKYEIVEIEALSFVVISSHIFGNTVVADVTEPLSYDITFKSDGTYYGALGHTTMLHVSGKSLPADKPYFKYVIIDSVGRVRIDNDPPP